MESIQAADKPLQYRAVGILEGRLQKVEVPEGPGGKFGFTLTTVDGKVYKAIVKRYRVHKKLNKGVSEGYWMVYPKFIPTGVEGEYDLAWEVASYHRDVNPEDIDRFSLRGVLVKRSPDNLRVRIRRNNQVNDEGRYLKVDKRIAVTVNVRGCLPPSERRGSGWFWDIEAQFDRESGVFELIDASPVALVDKKPTKPMGSFSLKPVKKHTPPVPISDGTPRAKPAKPITKQKGASIGEAGMQAIPLPIEPIQPVQQVQNEGLLIEPEGEVNSEIKTKAKWQKGTKKATGEKAKTKAKTKANSEANAVEGPTERSQLQVVSHQRRSP